MKPLLTAAMACLMLTGCITPRSMVIVPSNVKVLKQTAKFTLGQRDGNGYIIYASDLATALDAAEHELNCRNSTCIIANGGVVVFVNKPVE